VLRGSNPRHSPCKGDALPAELSTRSSIIDAAQIVSRVSSGCYGWTSYGHANGCHAPHPSQPNIACSVRAHWHMIIIITGLPATGKSTLARLLARRYQYAWIGKDSIIAPLLKVIGAADRSASRTLSDASFEVLFSIARDQARASAPMILEGNFRPGQHEADIRSILSACPANHTPGVAQILCRVDENERIDRLNRRLRNAEPSAAHTDADASTSADRRSDAYLDLDSARFACDGLDADRKELERVDAWRRRLAR
jgi:predicted kinase